MDDKEIELAALTPPFEPKLIRLTNGQTYAVPRIGCIAIGQVATSIVVEGRLHQIANVNIASIEPLVAIAK